MQLIQPKRNESLKAFMSRFDMESTFPLGMEDVEIDALAISAWIGARRASKKFKNFDGIDEMMANEQAIIVDAPDTIYINGSIGSWFGEAGFGALFAAVNELGSPDTLNVRINSEGGEVFEGFAMANYLSRYPGTLRTYNEGMAFSIASNLFLAGQERIVSDRSWLMIHLPETMAFGNVDEFNKTTEVLEKIGTGLADNYAAVGDKDTDEFYQLMRDETWFDGKEALEIGFATEMRETNAVVNYVDCGSYRHPPKQLALARAKQQAKRAAQNLKAHNRITEWLKNN